LKVPGLVLDLLGSLESDSFHKKEEGLKKLEKTASTSVATYQAISASFPFGVSFSSTPSLKHLPAIPLAFQISPSNFNMNVYSFSG
jgi:hypothetical protein